jgi:hypothetical protein
VTQGGTRKQDVNRSLERFVQGLELGLSIDDLWSDCSRDAGILGLDGLEWLGYQDAMDNWTRFWESWGLGENLANFCLEHKESSGIRRKTRVRKLKANGRYA